MPLSKSWETWTLLCWELEKEETALVKFPDFLFDFCNCYYIKYKFNNTKIFTGSVSKLSIPFLFVSSSSNVSTLSDNVDLGLPEYKLSFPVSLEDLDDLLNIF